jgi:hypothetical protein
MTTSHQSVALPLPEPAAHEFDFWIGTWSILQRILQPDGAWREFDARTTVTPDLDGYVLVEHWEGVVLLPWEGMTEPEPRKAISIRLFDPVAGVWDIYWLDTRNRHFIPPSTGKFQDGKSEFFSTLDPNNPNAHGRITFSNITTTAVTWDFAVLDSAGWSTIWIMEMKRV